MLSRAVTPVLTRLLSNTMVQRGTPILPTAKKGVLTLPTAKREVPTFPTAKWEVPTFPTAKWVVPTLPTAKREVPTVPTAKREVPALPTAKREVPTFPMAKREIPILPTALGIKGTLAMALLGSLLLTDTLPISHGHEGAITTSACLDPMTSIYMYALIILLCTCLYTQCRLH